MMVSRDSPGCNCCAGDRRGGARFREGQCLSAETEHFVDVYFFIIFSNQGTSTCSIARRIPCQHVCGHLDFMAWEKFWHYCHFVRNIHRSPRNSLLKGQSFDVFFLCCWPEQAVKITVELPVFRHAMTLMWRDCNSIDMHQHPIIIPEKHSGSQTC